VLYYFLGLSVVRTAEKKIHRWQVMEDEKELGSIKESGLWYRIKNAEVVTLVRKSFAL
jgi:hypothetical protein